MKEFNVAHRYVAATLENKDIQTIGNLTLSDYGIIEGNETYEAKEGYEWRIIRFLMEFNDDNTWRYGGYCL